MMFDNNLSFSTLSGGGLRNVGADFEAVFPTVLQCFAIIGGGYLARRLNLIGANDLGGIRVLLVYFLMPTMITQAILGVHWEKLNWRFIACVFVAKTFVFVAVAAVTLALSNDLAKAGIYGIFASQSNDMALGCPLIKALYGSSHPEYIDYLYLLMPISLVILNPIGFLMMEIEGQRQIAITEHREGNDSVVDRRSLFCRVLLGIAANPMIISTLIGLIGSIFLGRNHVPNLVNVMLDGFSSGFITVALFMLGCTLVNSGKPDAHYPLGTALLLSLAKILLLPLLLRELVSLTNIGKSEKDGWSLMIFAFLYGSLPTAPTVFVFACQYNVAVKQISTALALVTLLSAPWLYLSSKMISISHMDKTEYDVVYSLTEFDTAIVGVVFAVICIFVFVITSKIRRVPHVFVLCILISSIISCIGILIGEPKDFPERFIWHRMLSRTLILWGELSLRLFAIFLAIAMTILRLVGLCLLLRLRGTLNMVGFCLPLFFALSIVLSAEMSHTGGISKVDFDKISAYVTTVVVTLCLVSNVALIIYQHKCGRVSRGCVHHTDQTRILSNRATQETMRGTSAQQDDELPDIEDTVSKRDSGQRCDGCGDNRAISVGSNGNDFDTADDLRLLEPIDDELSIDGPSTSQQVVRPMCSSSVPCSSEQRYKCKRLLRQYLVKTRPINARSVSLCEPNEMPDDLESEPYSNGSDTYELTKHSLLVSFLCISMTVSLFVALWKNVQLELQSGTFLQLRLLDTVFLYGQPVVIFILFGLDSSWIPGVRRRLRRLCYGSEKLVLPTLSNIDGQTKAVCDQFTRLYLSRCASEIMLGMRNTSPKRIFRGVDLVDWLIKNGVVDGRPAAVKYGRRLILGRIIEHVSQEEHFYDSTTLFYHFIISSGSNVDSYSC